MWFYRHHRKMVVIARNYVFTSTQEEALHNAFENHITLVNQCIYYTPARSVGTTSLAVLNKFQHHILSGFHHVKLHDACLLPNQLLPRHCKGFRLLIFSFSCIYCIAIFGQKSSLRGSVGVRQLMIGIAFWERGTTSRFDQAARLGNLQLRKRGLYILQIPTKRPNKQTFYHNNQRLPLINLLDCKA